MIIFIIYFSYFLLGFIWIYLHYNIHRRQSLNQLSALSIIFWPISFLTTIPRIYKLLRRKLNI